jgi:hypothetical protein
MGCELWSQVAALKTAYRIEPKGRDRIWGSQLAFARKRADQAKLTNLRLCLGFVIFIRDDKGPLLFSLVFRRSLAGLEFPTLKTVEEHNP